MRRNVTVVSNKFVIGLTGPIGSGCTTLSQGLEGLEKEGFKRISLSKLIKEKFVELHHKEPTLISYGEDWRAELQDIGNRGRTGEFATNRSPKEDYRNYWVKLALENVDANNIVIDGIRNIGEVEWLRKQFPQFWLIDVYADYLTQWNRIKNLDLYSNEKVFERDNRRDSGEDEVFGQNVQRCVYESDYVFKNVEQIEPARRREKILAENIMQDIPGMRGEKPFRDPFSDEVFMATAVSQSHASHCLKRKVGALIIDEVNNIPLSVGYNDNPIGMESCFSLYNRLCYKDMVMESKLEKMVPFFCPECGKEHEDGIGPPWKCDGKKHDNTPCRCNFKLKFFPSRNIELCTAIHAEERAIRSLGYRRAQGCTIYVNTFPCFQCARHIKDAGINKVVYIEPYPIEEAVDYLIKNGITIEPFEGFKPRVFNQVFRQVE
jgi:deoxycytidylate deaminase